MPRSLPSQPSLEYVRKEAKRLLAAHQNGDASVCNVLRLHYRFQGAGEADILAADVSLQEVQHALALDYGFESWSRLKAHIQSAGELSKGTRFDWRSVIGDGQPHCRVEGDQLVVENPAGNGAALHVELGGMSWDNYRLGVDVMVERESSEGAGLSAGVQLCPRGTSVYCQLFRGAVILAYWDDKREEHFTHLARIRLPAPIGTGTWRRFEIVVEDPHVAILLNGVEVARKEIPVGTAGMPGLLVNYASDGKVRLRNLRIQFLNPTQSQVEEFNTGPATNWENYKRKQVEAGLRKGMDDNSL